MSLTLLETILLLSFSPPTLSPRICRGNQFGGKGGDSVVKDGWLGNSWSFTQNVRSKQGDE